MSLSELPVSVDIIAFRGFHDGSLRGERMAGWLGYVFLQGKKKMLDFLCLRKKSYCIESSCSCLISVQE